MKKVLFFVVAICFLFSGIAFSDTIKIGVMGPMTGAWASEGREMKKVVTLLADDLNQKGGLLGQKVEVICEDDGGDPRTASLAANRLAMKGIVAVIGTYGSSITEATQNIYNEEKIIQIANGSTAIRLSEKGFPYFFRTCPRDDEQGRIAAHTIKKYGYKNVAILHDNTTYAKGLAQETKMFLEKSGLNIIFFDALTPGEQDYNAILTKLKSAKPDVVFFTGYYPEAGLLLRQKKEMNWNVPFIGGDATNHPDLVKIAGKDSSDEFCFLSPPLPKDLTSNEAKSFLESYTQKYGEPPNSIYSVLAGDGFRIITAAIKAVRSTSAKNVAEYLHKNIKDFPGLTGKISFDEKGDRIGEVYRIYKVGPNGNFILQP
jgi:branched-chain amino acid transport system substrate-binding protein